VAVLSTRVAALIVTFLLLGLALGATTLLQIRFGLRPLSALRAGVTAIRRGEAERIRGEFPHDVAPLASELNLLLDTNREILDRARTQVGNLAHALKTPLSVIVNEAGNAPKDVGARVREQAATMRDQVDYYLDRARAAALAGTLGTLTDVEPVLAGLARTMTKLHPDKDLAIDLSVAPGARFRGERQDLEEMTGNLMDPQVIKFMKPEHVSTAVAWMCSENCKLTGQVVGAAGGFYTALRYYRTEGISFDPSTPATLEQFDEQSGTLFDFDHMVEFAGVSKAVQAMLKEKGYK